jgi:hypothetical protein
VIVFPKFVKGTVPLTEGGTAPASKIEVGVICPAFATCPEHQPVKIHFHWVCPGAQKGKNTFICETTDFDVTAEVREKIVITPDSVFDGVTNHVVPAAECPRGYLIGWVINTSDQPIKFDGLIGNAVLRASGSAEASYSARAIQADPMLATGDLIATLDGGLVFDGEPGHYTSVTGRVSSDVRYSDTTGPVVFGSNTTSSPAPLTVSFLTLLTLDVAPNRPNNPVFVPLNFYAANPSLLGKGNVVSTSVNFVCWTEKRIDVLNGNLITALMGRDGLFTSDQAEKVEFAGIVDNTGPVNVLGLVETIEGATRAYVSIFFNDIFPGLGCFDCNVDGGGTRSCGQVGTGLPPKCSGTCPRGTGPGGGGTCQVGRSGIGCVCRD